VEEVVVGVVEVVGVGVEVMDVDELEVVDGVDIVDVALVSDVVLLIVLEVDVGPGAWIWPSEISLTTRPLGVVEIVGGLDVTEDTGAWTWPSPISDTTLPEGTNFLASDPKVSVALPGFDKSVDDCCCLLARVRNPDDPSGCAGSAKASRKRSDFQFMVLKQVILKSAQKG
jgi:hypothetical protein